MNGGKMKNYLIGMDIGGTHVRTGLYSIEKKMIVEFNKISFIQGETAKEEIEVNICEQILRVLYQKQISLNSLKGIGISMAGNVDQNIGCVHRWPNHHLWEGFPIYNYIHEYFHTPVIVEDDGNCAAVGESMEQYGDEHYKGNLIYCTIGTGIGGGIILNHRLHKGEYGMAGELGHLSIPEVHKLCGCGKTDCLQSIITDKHMEEKVGRHTAGILYQLAYILDIPKVIVGGGRIEYNQNLFQYIVSIFNQYKEADHRNYSIEKSKLYNKNGILGVIELLRNGQ